jgi:hypothetical protein
MVIQQSGSFENAINSAMLNDKNLSQSISIGTEIKTENQTTKKIEPATALGNENDLVPLQKGIGWMQIGKTFRVN